MGSVLTPYYESDGITIYNCRWEEILPAFAPNSIDLLVVDPPYLHLNGDVILPETGRNVVGNPWDANTDWLRPAWTIAALGMFVCCSFKDVTDVRTGLPEAQPVALLTWYKRNSPPAVQNVPRYMTEFIWAFKKSPGLDWHSLGSTLIDIPKCAPPERIMTRDGAAHPSQKPVALIHRLLRVGGTSLLDPFAGTGTSLVAAKQVGIRAIGIEKDERYCELAANRLAQGVMALGV